MTFHIFVCIILLLTNINVTRNKNTLLFRFPPYNHYELNTTEYNINKLYIFFMFSENLHHPLSLDVFENHLFWVTRDNGAIIKQDKFGRGIPVTLSRQLVNPTGVKGRFNYFFFQCVHVV